MANLLLVVDPDPARRAKCVGSAESMLSPFDGLRTERCAAGDFCAIWARERRAPISWVGDPRSAAVVWGDAIGTGQSRRVEAGTLAERWRDVNAAEAFDGFHAAAFYDRDGLRVGGDLLGLFPLYYWSGGDVVLVGSSAELFRHHPLFQRKLSLAGLVGILLTSHLVDGQTALEDVRRVAPGALLVCAAGAKPREITRYRLRVSRRLFDRPFSSHLDLLNDALERATAQHAPPGLQHTLLLSGGLDSRMLAGYLAQNGTAAVTLTLGYPRDLDMITAKRVAGALRFAHHTGDTPFEQYPLYADRQAKWEHVSNGFSTIRLWGLPPLLQPLPPRVVAGYVTDAIVGGPLVHYIPQHQARGLSFEIVFDYYNRTALHPNALRKLLRKDIFAGLVEHTIGRLRALYEGYSDLDAQRAWCFELHHRQRFHVGGSAWRLSFGAWPVLPSIDREVLEAVGAMPDSTVARRHAQKELVVRRFPLLAALPLDRNSYSTRPLKPSLGWLLADSVRRSWTRLLRRRPSGWQRETRYYYRVYDINNPGWQAVREKAEPHRARVLHLFERDALNALLPPPGAPVDCADAIVDTSGMKLLLGLLLWSEANV